MHISLDKNKLAILLAALISAAVFAMLQNHFLHTVSRVVMAGQFAHDIAVTVSRIDEQGQRQVVTSFEEKGQDAPMRRIGTEWFNVPTKQIQFVFTAQQPLAPDAYLDIQRIEMHMAYSDTVTVYKHRFASWFNSRDFRPGTGAKLFFDDNGRAALIAKRQIVNPSIWPSLLMALCFGVGIYLIIKFTQWSRFPAFFDMSLGRSISSAHEFDTINGIRGLAAMLVLISHTAPGFYALQMGLTILFVISGFLLSKPFVLDNRRIFSIDTIQVYLIKRIRRILPMYFAFVFITYVPVLEIEKAIRHFLFLQAEGHLWPMTQIFIFYLLLPLVLLITSAAHRVAKILPLLLLGVAIVVYINGYADTFSFYSGSYSHPFYLYAFLIGVFASYLNFSWVQSSEVLVNWLQRNRHHVSMVAIVITAMVILWSAPIRPPDWALLYIKNFYFKCIMSGVIIIMALNTPKTFYNWLISNWLFRSVGVVGFSFYLLHGLGMDIVSTFQEEVLGMKNPSRRSWLFTLYSFIVTYCMAIITYSFIERPFFGFKDKQQAANKGTQ